MKDLSIFYISGKGCSLVVERMPCIHEFTGSKPTENGVLIFHALKGEWLTVHLGKNQAEHACEGSVIKNVY